MGRTATTTKQGSAGADSKDLTTTSQVVKRKRNRPDLQNFGFEKANPGDNTRYLRAARAAFQLPKIDISDAKQVEKRIADYFTFCEDNDIKPDIKNLGNWLGVSDQTVINWRKGIYREDTHLELIKKAVDVIQALWWMYGNDSKGNPASWIFIGKNAFGMKDQQELVIEPRQGLTDQDAETIAAKYAELPE